MIERILKYFCSFLFVIFLFPVQAKNVIVLLDNSASMNQQGGEEFSQCDAAVFSLQLVLSTVHKEDNVYVIPAYRRGTDVQVLKNPSVSSVRKMRCVNASFFKSLLKSLELTESLKNESPTSFIMIGDGEWFIEGDEITEQQTQKLINRLYKLSSEVKMWYINTSTLNNHRNDFDKIINSVRNKSAYVSKIDTDNKVNKLLSAFEAVTKQLLNIPLKGGQDYKLAKSNILFETEIPTEEIFVLVQSINNPFDLKLTSVHSSNDKLAIHKRTSINKGEIYGGFYSVKNNRGGLIKPGEIVFQFDKQIPPNAHISVFYLHGIYDAKPFYAGNPKDLIRFKDGTYLVCSDLSSFPVSYELRDKNRKALDIDNSSVQVSLLNKQGELIKNIKSSEDASFSTDILLDLTKDSEDFQFKVRIGNAYETIIPIRINKKRCVSMSIASKEFQYKHRLSSDTVFSQSMELPEISDSETKQILQNEQKYIEYKITGDTAGYKVQISDNIKIFAPQKEENICSECLRIAREKEIQIEFLHPNLKEKAIYTIHINQTDESLFKRCFWCFVAIILALLLISYLILLSRKKRFYRKNKRKAQLTRYINDEMERDLYLETGLLNKLNPFIPEKKKLYGLSCVATRNQTIRVNTSALKSKSSRGFKIYECSADGFRFELTEDELENKKYIELTPDNGLEFSDGYDRERIIYEIN